MTALPSFSTVCAPADGSPADVAPPHGADVAGSDAAPSPDGGGIASSQMTDYPRSVAGVARHVPYAWGGLALPDDEIADLVGRSVVEPPPYSHAAACPGSDVTAGTVLSPNQGSVPATHSLPLDDERAVSLLALGQLTADCHLARFDVVSADRAFHRAVNRGAPWEVCNVLEQELDAARDRLRLLRMALDVQAGRVCGSPVAAPLGGDGVEVGAGVPSCVGPDAIAGGVVA